MRKLWKKALAGLLVAGMMLTPVSGSGIDMAFAEDVLLISPNPNAGTVYDFKDGSVVPTDAPGNTTITYGDMTIKCGPSNAYKYKDASHGVQFKDGNSIEIAVDGPTKVTVGDCSYSGIESLTMTNAEGTWSQTATTKAGCEHNDGSAMTFWYDGAATTLIIKFDGSAYVPSITVAPNTEITEYNFRDGSVVPTDAPGNTTIEFDALTIKCGPSNAYKYKDTSHGVHFKDGNSIEIKVDGPSTIEIGDCAYSGVDSLTMTNAEGTWSQTSVAKNGCYHNDGSEVKFAYNGEATTLILNFDGQAYVPSITVKNYYEASAAGAPAEPEPPKEGVVTETGVAGVDRYVFTDGSALPEKKYSEDVTVGNLTVKANGKEYKLNGSQHGYQFANGNSIEIKVDGPATIEVGDCYYNNMTELTLVSADGTYSQTEAFQKNCWDQDGSSATFRYDGGPTTLTIAVTATIYVPFIEVTEDVAEENGVKADSMYMYNFVDGSVIPAAYTASEPLTDGNTIESAEGNLALIGNKAVYYSGSKNGAVFSNGDYMEVKVAGDAIISLVLGANTDAGSKWLAVSDKGSFNATSLSAKPADFEGQVAVFKYTGVATTLKFVAETGGSVYIHGVNVMNLPAEAETPALVGNGKIDVWDFGLDTLDPDKYNNMLSVDIVNSWYPADVEAGSTGPTINSFATEDIFFNASNAVNNRYRSMAEGVTKYDAKSKKFALEDGTTTTLNGFVYSNSSSTALVNMGIRLYEGDVLTMYLSSNGGVSNVEVETPSGETILVPTSGDSSFADKRVIYAGETGIYRLYTRNEKLVVCRLEREHKAPVQVTGTVTAPESLSDYEVVFTCAETGAETTAAPVDGKYSAWLYDSYNYTISLKNANGYVVESDVNVAVNGTEAVTKDVTIGKVNLITVEGKVEGLGEAALGAVEFKFVNEDAVFVPELELDGDKFVAQFESGVAYNVVAEKVNDYDLLTTEVKFTESASGAALNFKAKPVYDVTVKVTGMEDADLAKAEITFTNINDTDYTYTFKGTDKMALRDGQYTVSLKNVEGYDYGYIKDVKVNGAASGTEIKFTYTGIKEWDFAKVIAAKGGPGIVTNGDVKSICDLILTGSVGEDAKGYLLVNEGTVQVPVKAGQIVTIEYCYEAAFNVAGEGGEVLSVDEKSGSTNQLDSVAYEAVADGYVTITGVKGAVGGRTFFTKISVAPKAVAAEYKEVVTVGKNKDYATINEALAAIAKMNRTDDQRVTVMIDPGNYEEMLVINVPNVTLKNAAGNKASLKLTNKGVDIDKNAVRITSYYGHGYSYYSMGSDCKYDAELLEVNKANGYLNFENPGTGTTSGSYWNATVVVYADGFAADGIIFENSFNQYISAKEANDVVLYQGGTPKGGTRPTTVGDTSVQNKNFVERAAALAIANNVAQTKFTNCKFVGRQDTLYGGTASTVAFDKCDILGACDYIFGPMVAVFNECNLVMNTSEDKNDVAYLTAPQQASGRGYLFWNCTVTSTTPGVDTASEFTSKPGYLGRPWAPNTSEAVFVNTTIEAADENWGGGSLIIGEAWLTSLGGKSAGMQELGTIELATDGVATTTYKVVKGDMLRLIAKKYDCTIWDIVPLNPRIKNPDLIYIDQILVIPTFAKPVDNRAARADWATVLKEAKLNDGTDISTKEKAFNAFLGEWTPFEFTEADKKPIDVKKEDPKPTVAPTPKPTAAPTPKPTVAPTVAPTQAPEAPAASTGIDLTAGLTAGVDYNGISVLESMSYKEGSVEIEGVTYAGSVAGKVNPSPKGGQIPTEGAAVVAAPKANGTLTVVFKLNDGKTYHVVCSDGTELETGSNDSGSSKYLKKSYKVEAGKTYYVYGDGTKLPFYFIGLE